MGGRCAGHHLQNKRHCCPWACALQCVWLSQDATHAPYIYLIPAQTHAPPPKKKSRVSQVEERALQDITNAEGQCSQLQSELSAARTEFKRYQALKVSF